MSRPQIQAPRHALWRDQRLLTGREYHLHLELEPVCGHPAACNRVLARLFCDGRCLLLASREASATATWRCPATHPARAAGAAGQRGHRPRGDTFDSSQGARQLMDVRSHRALRSLPETPTTLAKEDAALCSLLDRPTVTQYTAAADSWGAHRRRCAARLSCQWAPLAILGQRLCTKSRV